VDLFRREMDSLFDRFFDGWPAPFEEDFGSRRLWDFDVREDDKEVVVRAEVPGFEENELNVEMDDNVLSIRAEKQQEGDGGRSYRSFYRSVALPPGIDAEKAQASYRNGVLELHFPRPEGRKGKRIPVQGQRADTGRQTPEKRSGNGSSQAGNKPEAAQSAPAAAPQGKK
jgi:HSP20 family protein